MKPQLPLLTKITIAALVATAVSLWIQWLSGDPAFPKFPPGPIFFIVIAMVIYYGRRLKWTPLLGSLVSLMTTSGFLARMPAEMLRLTHPAQVGKFAVGIFFGVAMQAMALLVGDVAGIAATIMNYCRKAEIRSTDSAL
jgi:hypothetical protein